MRGGSMNYICYKLEEQISCLCDKELEEMTQDFANLLHDCEWWHSCDSCEKDYRKTAREFKKKWFNGDRTERLEKIVNESCDNLKNRLLEVIGVEGKKCQ